MEETHSHDYAMLNKNYVWFISFGQCKKNVSVGLLYIFNKQKLSVVIALFYRSDKFYQKISVEPPGK